MDPVSISISFALAAIGAFLCLFSECMNKNEDGVSKISAGGFYISRTDQDKKESFDNA